MKQYPEHEKMAAVREQSQTIGEFLDWLRGEHIHLSRYERIEGLRDPWLVDIHESITVLLARYFDIDLDVIENEKRTMLASLAGASDDPAA